MFPGRVRTGSITPYEYGKRVVGVKSGNVLWHEQRMSGQVLCFGHYDLVRPVPPSSITLDLTCAAAMVAVARPMAILKIL